MKRIALFLLTNLAIVVGLGALANLLGVNHWMTREGLDLGALLGFCLVFGFGGAIISLLISRPIAKWSTGARVISGEEGLQERLLVATVQALSAKAGLPMPQVAIFNGPPNAFATGATRNSSLVAVSTGLLEQLKADEVEAVLAHEIAHIANGDMVTLTLIQGVVNTFVMFLARVVGYLVDIVLREDDNNAGQGAGYHLTVLLLDILFGILASLVVAAFSRRREYRADAGAAELLGNPENMIAALRALRRRAGADLPQNLQAFGVAGKSSMLSLFASHPPLDARIEALQKRGAR